MTKIDIISGFLGAGKTTLIKKLLSEAFTGEQVVLIENEFGEIGIDGGFLKEAGIEIREMNSGCICCSLVGDFGEALTEVIDTYHPDRIIIEPSGVGKLSDVIGAVSGVKSDELVLNSTTTVVDVNKCKMYMKNFGEFYRNQVETAKTIILSRTDVAKEGKAEDAVHMIREMNDKAAIITTPIAELDGKKILQTMEYVQTLDEMMKETLEQACEHHHHHDHDEHCTCGCHDHDHDHEHHHDHDHEHHEHHHDNDEHCTCGCHDHDHHDHHHHHHADEVFTSWGRETMKKYTKAQIESILDALNDQDKYGFVLRAKGMVASEEGPWVYFDMVPDELEVRTGEADVTGRLCVIGSKLDEAALAELFEV